MSQIKTKFIENLAVTNAKVATGIDAAKIADGSVSNAEFQYLNGVTSDIQTQLNSKQASGNYITDLTGDATASGPGSAALTLATVNSNVGSFTNANITVNAKGLITAASNGTAGANTTLSNLTSPTAINQDLLPDAANTRDIGGSTSQFANVRAQSLVATSLNLRDGFPGSTGAIGMIEGLTNRTLSSGDVSQLTIWSNNLEANIGIQAGNATGTATKSIFLTTGNADANLNSGNIKLYTGTVSGTGVRGKIKFVDGSNGTVGHVWTQTNADGSGEWQAVPSGGATNNKTTITLNSTDITNQYVDLSHVAVTNSIIFMVKGSGYLLEGASQDYSVNYTGGAGGNTRITFLNDLATGGAAELQSGDVVQIQYQY